MAKLTARELHSSGADSDAQDARPARDVQRLLRVADARDQRYEELHNREQRRGAAERWPLLKATDIALAMRRHLSEDER